MCSVMVGIKTILFKLFVLKIPLLTFKQTQHCHLKFWTVYFVHSKHICVGVKCTLYNTVRSTQILERALKVYNRSEIYFQIIYISLEVLKHLSPILIGTKILFIIIRTFNNECI